MKRFVCLFVLSLCLASSSLFGQEERVWNIEPTSSHWAREEGSLEISLDENVKYEGVPCVKAIHKGRQDWNFTYSKALKVTPGEVYEISCPVRVEGSGNMGNSSIIQTGKKIVMYGYARTETSDTAGQWKMLKSTFVVPRNITSLCPRMTGAGEATVWFGPHKLRKLPPRTMLDANKTWTIENSRLKVTLSARDVSFSVLDKKTGRLWNQLADSNVFFPSKVDATDSELTIEAFDAATLQDYRFGIRLDSETNEIVATVDAVDHTTPIRQLYWPYSFASKEGDWLIIPFTEGFNFPVTDRGPCGRWNGYGGLSMAFCSQVEDTSGAGYVAILETPDDAGVQVLTSPVEANAPANSPALLLMRPVWEAQRRTFGYARSIRYSFFDQGRHVAACKRYRRYAKETGLLMSFEEKARRNPALAEGLARLKGAANIWYFGRNKLDVFHDMLALGMEHLLWSGGGKGDEIAEMNRSPHVLTSRYDIYQDLVDPALHSQLGGIPGSHLKGAWPKDIMWKDPEGTHTKGWHAPNKAPNKPRIPCDVLCDTKSLDYANRVIPEDLAKVPYTARFIDTTTSTPWRECWNPDHPMTRTDSR
ncbi:MAG: hypothetical protein Q4G59_11935, partial [Planctomycetia bacterium]|nr:hypothetical protein [Planctomycetia bacterium]